jgi:rare lipoprotein A
MSDYPMVLGPPVNVDGVVYTPADTMNYDMVGHAAISPVGGNGITASHRTLPLPSYVEMTALDSGRTILVRLERRGPMTGSLLTELSPAAAAQLGVLGQERAAVRVRRVNPPEPERAALRAGGAAPARMDMPPSLRTVLLRRLNQPAPEAELSRPVPMPAILPSAPAPTLVARAEPIQQPSSWLVQVGAFSTRLRAEAVAKSLGAQVTPARSLWRVRQTGFATKAAAEAALAQTRSAGYPDARMQQAD